jgi:hypothetical protein
MPSAHRDALKKLLASTEQRMAEFQRRLLSTTDDAERTVLIDTLAELNIARDNVRAVLTGEEPPNNFPATSQ